MGLPGEDEAKADFAKIGQRGVRNVALKALGVFSLRNERIVNLDGEFGALFFKFLKEETGTPHDPESSKTLLKKGFILESMQPFVEFIWWMIRMGYAIPSHETDGDRHTHVTRIVITAAGKKFMSAYTTGDHFLAANFVERLKGRCPGVSDDVLTHLDDAAACLEHALQRPAIVLIGLAYEAALEHLGERLVTRGKLDSRKFERAKAWERIELIKVALPHLGLDAKEEKPRVERGLDFAHKLRERRNDGSHTTPEFSFADAAEIEEFLISACRHLPSLWVLMRMSPAP